MQYFGGKSAIAKWIAKRINRYEPKVYLEPFCGSCWVGQLVVAETRVFSDINPALITMWNSLLEGWVPPAIVDEDEYRQLKNIQNPDDPKTAFVGFGCSFAGKYFGGYARCRSRTYAVAGKYQLMRRIPDFDGSIFISTDYRKAISIIKPDVVYMDPPYRNTTKYYGCPDFDSSLFWNVVRIQSRLRVVLVSEYDAPKDFEAVMEIPTTTKIRDSSRQPITRTEKVYMLKGGIGYEY